MKKHNYELGDRVIITDETPYKGYKGIIIAKQLKDPEYYSSDYTVALEGCTENVYGKKKRKKYHVEEEHVMPVRTIKAYCFQNINTGEYRWTSSPLSMPTEVDSDWMPVSELDFKKDLVS